VPGLILVLVGPDTAVGVVPFLPVDGTGAALPQPKNTYLFYYAPARGPVETVCTIAGLDFDDGAVPRYNDRNSTRLFNVKTVNFPLIGDVIFAYGVVDPYTDPGVGTIQLLDHGNSNELPFTVE